MTEAEEMRKYAEAYGCGEKDIIRKSDGDGKYEFYMDYFKSYGITIDVEEKSARPLPCVRVGRKAIKNCTDKEHFAKIDEELNELKEAVILYSSSDYGNLECIADEAADTITAITTMLEALGIDAAMRDEAQRRVNAKNRERGRL